MRIINELRLIRAIIVGCGESATVYSTTYPVPCEEGKCDCIEPYYENGQMAETLWFNIYKGLTVVTRVNSTFVSEIKYKE